MKAEYKNLTVDKATHKLRCGHYVGSNGFDYFMKCIPLGKTKSGRLKILVFGERYWKGKDHLKSIRYVPSWKVSEFLRTPSR